MKRAFWAFGFLVFCTSAFYCAVFIVKNLAQFPPLDWASSQAYFGFSAAIAAYLLSQTVSFFAWHILLSAIGQRDPAIVALSIGLIAQFAKYVPGNVAHLIGRVALARRWGIDTVRVALSMTIEVGWTVLAGLTIAMITVLVAGPWPVTSPLRLPGAWTIAAIALAAVVVPLGATHILKRWRPGPLARQLDQAAVLMPSTGALVVCYCLYLLVFLMLGLTLYLIAWGMLGTAPALIWIMMGIFAFAWIAGFVTPGAPGGLGVREAALLIALDPLLGAGPALGVTIGLRLVTTAGDIVAFGVGFLCRVRAQRYAEVRNEGSVLSG